MGFYLADLIFVIVTQALFFAAGWLFFVQKLLAADYKIRSKFILSLFASTFALSCTLFELIIFEILDILNRRYADADVFVLQCSMRWMLWKLSIVGMLSMVIIVLPMYQIRMLVVGKNRGISRPGVCALCLYIRLAGSKCHNVNRIVLGSIHLGILEGWRSVSDSQQGAWYLHAASLF